MVSDAVYNAHDDAFSGHAYSLESTVAFVRKFLRDRTRSLSRFSRSNRQGRARGDWLNSPRLIVMRDSSCNDDRPDKGAR